MLKHLSRNPFFLLLLLAGAMSMFSISKPQAAENFAVTGIHRAIAQESDWLNTSRALKPDDLAGRIILLDFWTFCCINCIHVIPDLQYLEHKFGDKLTVIGVHSAKFANERDRDNIRSAILRYGIEHPVVNDAAFKTWQSFAVRAWPTLILINPQGKIEETYSGEGNRAAVERDVARLIAENKNIVASPLPVDLEKNRAPSSIFSFPGKLLYVEKPDNKMLGDAPILFVADSSNNRIVAANLDITKGLPKKGTILFDSAKQKAEPAFNKPQGMLYRDGVLYVADTGNHLLRAIDFNQGGKITTLAGTGTRGSYRMDAGSPALSTALASPWDLAFYPSPDEITIANAGTHQLLTYSMKDKTLRILAGNGRESIDDGKYPYNSLSQPSGLSVEGNKLYFVDSETSSLRVLENGEIKTLIGTGLFDFGLKDGKQGQALLQHSLGVYADKEGAYIADSYNHALRFYNYKTGLVSTLSGNGGRGFETGRANEARFNEPNDIKKIGDYFVVADTNNNRILAFDPSKRETGMIEIMPPAEPLKFSKAEELPNLSVTKDATVGGGKAVPISLDLSPGWKINADAPSYLGLFDGLGNNVETYDKERIKRGKLLLPPLEKGKGYHLQGTLYYCEEDKQSLCLIRSFDQKITAQTMASDDQIRFDLKVKLGE